MQQVHERNEKAYELESKVKENKTNVCWTKHWSKARQREEK